ncbi:hypothetical protein PG996_004991 [Apiospora saccharicola]|uniref:Uncharacterized protein n=1 Tax=Apiospora saccharicola TaxID=335842 RepID=A0ABR1VP82_9PEZI
MGFKSYRSQPHRLLDLRSSPRTYEKPPPRSRDSEWSNTGSSKYRRSEDPELLDAEREDCVAVSQATIQSLEARVELLAADVKSRDQEVQMWRSEVQSKDQQVQMLKSELQVKDQRLRKFQDMALAPRDSTQTLPDSTVEQKFLELTVAIKNFIMKYKRDIPLHSTDGMANMDEYQHAFLQTLTEDGKYLGTAKLRLQGKMFEFLFAEIFDVRPYGLQNGNLEDGLVTSEKLLEKMHARGDIDKFVKWRRASADCASAFEPRDLAREVAHTIGTFLRPFVDTGRESEQALLSVCEKAARLNAIFRDADGIFTVLRATPDREADARLYEEVDEETTARKELVGQTACCIFGALVKNVAAQPSGRSLDPFFKGAVVVYK